MIQWHRAALPILVPGLPASLETQPFRPNCIMRDRATTPAPWLASAMNTASQFLILHARPQRVRPETAIGGIYFGQSIAPDRHDLMEDKIVSMVQGTMTKPATITRVDTCLHLLPRSDISNARTGNGVSSAGCTRAAKPQVAPCDPLRERLDGPNCIVNNSAPLNKRADSAVSHRIYGKIAM